MHLNRLRIFQKRLLLLVLLLPAAGSFAQSSTKNYVQTRTFLDADSSSFLRHIDYYDELGRLTDARYSSSDGNMLTSVRDNASHQSYAGATDFDGVAGREYPLTYNGMGSLTSDAGRKIARIDYDYRNNPVRIQFTNGNVTKYVYSATGEKLRVIYQTAVPNITVAIGNSRELARSEIQYTDSTDYLLGGSLTLKSKGLIEKSDFAQ